MRELSRPLRETPDCAVGASRTAHRLRGAAKVVLFALAVGVFLAFVGAFGSSGVPPLPRYVLFSAVSLACAGVASGVVFVTWKVPVLAARPWLRQLVIAVVLTPATALVVWGIVGFAAFGRPDPKVFVAYLEISAGMTVAMSALSQMLFRKGILAKPAAAAVAGEAAGAPNVRFLERLPANLKGAALYAVEAEDHYVRVHTDRGSTLILMRLADAAAELEGLEGARVHRSWWVAKAAVSGGARRGAQTVLKLAGGVEAPVSRSQVAELRRAGWL